MLLQFDANTIRYFVSQGAVWPAVDYELSGIKRLGLLRGTVLNAGAGWRDVSHLIDGTLINQDIRWPNDQRTT